jgi:LysR family glycine cleavage system transcriptional activator
LWGSTLSRFKDPCGWLQWCQQYVPESATNYKELRFGNGLLALEAALSGQGILPGCKNLLTSELTSGKLEILTGHTIQCATAYYVVSAGSSNERPIAKQFRQWLIDESQGKV